MPLTLTILRCPASVTPETRTVGGGEYSVGRGPGVDWVLADPDHTISRRHFIVAYRSGAWQISDESSNGTFINRDGAPVGKGNARNLRDNDRLRVGPYEIEVVLQDDSLRAAPAQPYPEPYAKPKAADPFAFDDPFGDPLRPVNDPPPGYGASEPPPAYRAPNPSPHAPNPHSPDSYAAQAGPVYRAPRQAPFQERTQEDHSSVMNDAMPPPAQIGQMPLHAGGQLSADGLLPDDWEKDLLEGIGNPPGGSAAPGPLARPPEPDPFAPTAPPQARTPNPQPAPYDAVQAQSLHPQSFNPQPLQSQPLQPQPAPPLDPFAPAAPVAAPIPPAAPVPPVAPPITATAAFPADVAPPPPPEPPLLDAFLAGIGLPEARPVDAVATMHRMGEAFRAMVAGLRAVLMARAAIKSEFRIDQTMFQARGNNPLKFSADDDDAITALLGVGRRTGIAPATAIGDALRDIRLHELASIAAMQSAIRALLAGLDPEKIRATVEQAGGLTLLPAQKKARAWDAYDALHQRTVQALSDDFDSVFGKAFARAYEEALQDLNSRERS